MMNMYNNKMESLEIYNNALKGQLEECKPTEDKKEEDMSKLKEPAAKNTNN